MSEDERREEILARVTAAEKSGILAADAQAMVIGDMFLAEFPSQWPHWVAKAQEESQDGWIAWHVVYAIVQRVWEQDPKKVTEPPLHEWVSYFLHKPAPPSRQRGNPESGRDAFHRVAVLGVYALVDAGLCDVIGLKKGGGKSACDLVAEALGVKQRTVYNPWLKHRKQLAASVNRVIPAVDPDHPDSVKVACDNVACRYDRPSSDIRDAWEKHGKRL